MPLTTEQIHAAADKLFQQGQQPTLAKIRKALGGGSFTTIGEAMQLWKEKQAQDQELAEIRVPDVVAERSQQFLATIWQTAMAEAENRLQLERSKFEEQQQQTSIAMQEAAEAVTVLEAEAIKREAALKQLQADLDASAKRTQAAEAKIQEVQRDLDAAKATAAAVVAGLEARLTDRQGIIDALIAKVPESPKKPKKKKEI